MIYGSSFVNPYPPASYVLSHGVQQTRLAIPVAPSNFIYSQFKHVAGFPAPEGVQGVTISKLKILDVLIDRLSQLKTKNLPQAPEIQAMTDGRIDALIYQYEKEISSAAAASTPYKAAPAAPAGVLFNLVA